MAATSTRPDPAVPTRVGVNRSRRHHPPSSNCCPHTRGGEPARLTRVTPQLPAVPTRVGVNRRKRRAVLPRKWLSPHVWGGTATGRCAPARPRAVPPRVGGERTR